MKIAKEIGEIADGPADEERKEAALEEEEKKFEKLAEELEKLDVDARDEPC